MPLRLYRLGNQFVMTIKRYLILLITTLIIVMAVFQIVLVNQVKQKIENEVELRGKRFANKIIEMTLNQEILDEELAIAAPTEHSPGHDSNHTEKLVGEKSYSKRTIVIDKSQSAKAQSNLSLFKIHITDNEDHRKIYHLVVPKDENKIAELVSQVLFEESPVTQKNVLTIVDSLKGATIGSTKDQINQVKIKVDKQPLSERDIKRLRRGKQNDFKFIHQKNNRFEHQKLQNAESRKNRSDKRQAFILDKLITSITYIILLTSVIGVLLVIWLSNKFSRPIHQLTDGFKRVSKGEKNVALTPSGTKEVQFAIGQFNEMTKKLAYLEEMEIKLKERTHLAEIGDVSKGIAHALRNPLHTIGLNLNLLQQENLTAEQRDKAFINLEQKMAQLDRSIAALLTLTSGEIERDTELDINHLVKDVVLELKQSHNSENNVLEVQYELAEQAQIKGELNELRSIVHTLVFNAYEASMEKNNVNIHLKITTLVTNEGLILKVEDNGGGIDPKIEEQLFSPHISSKAEGAGMGLYIAKRIAELYYNGNVSLTSQGNGAIATLTLSSRT